MAMNNIIQNAVATHFATFTSGFVIALSAAFGVNRLSNAQQQQRIQQQRNQAQVQQLQAQNKSLCLYLKQHRLAPPHGVVCK
jgi:hypothetical protein